jgi:amino-acid N-acetyltransferase
MSATQSAVAPIRPAAAADLASIEHLLVTSGLPTDGVRDIIAARPGDFFVAESRDANGGSELVGVAGLEVCCDNALLRSVAVNPEWRARGVGHELVRRVVCEAEGRGIRALYLLTQTAEHFFPKFGFEHVDRDAVPAEIAQTLEFKSACPSSAVAMVKSLA